MVAIFVGMAAVSVIIVAVQISCFCDYESGKQGRQPERAETARRVMA